MEHSKHPTVGPIGNSYFYRLGQYLSEPYANFQSAWVASQQQQALEHDTLIPVSRAVNGGNWAPAVVN